MPVTLDVAPCVRRTRTKPAYSKPAYSERVYSEPVYSEPIYSPPQRRRCSRLTIIRRVSVALLYCTAGAWFLRTGVKPYVHAHELMQQAGGLQQRVQAAEQRRQALQRRVDQLQTPQGKEAAARTYGWLLPGEVAIACPRPNTPLSHATDQQLLDVPAPSPPTLLDRAKRALEW